MKKLLLLFILIIPGFVGNVYSQIAVIANKSVPVDSIKKSELLDFYTGDIKKWQDKTPVIVLDLKPKNTVRESFYEFLGKSPSRMKSIWLKKMLSGEGDPPESLNSQEEVLTTVTKTPGAIGFVAQDKTSDKVKTLLIIHENKMK